uniref:Uncharacterized protein n=1 Tax=Timema cristinae TaxID=61476 RepID=A0A7R9CVM9_TIMCR|nr:unnamed protein product [Timema cristinae]
MFLCPVLLLLLPPETILSGLNQTGYPGEVSTTPKCRSRGLSLPEEEFRLHTCALCYHFMHPTSFQPTTRWTKVDGDIMRLKFGNATTGLSHLGYYQHKLSSLNGQPYCQHRLRSLNGQPYCQHKLISLNGQPYCQHSRTYQHKLSSLNGQPYCQHRLRSLNGQPYCQHRLRSLNGQPYCQHRLRSLNGQPYRQHQVYTRESVVTVLQVLADVSDENSSLLHSEADSSSLTVLQVLADVSDDDSPLLQSFAHPEAEANWRACCLEADRCCQNMTANNKTTGTTAFYSNAFLDIFFFGGVQLSQYPVRKRPFSWPRSVGGAQMAAPSCPDPILVGALAPGTVGCVGRIPHLTPHRGGLCPPFIHFGTAKHDCPLKAEKHCVAGWWGGHPENSSIEWTDYTTCSIVKDLKRRMHIGMAALSVSIAALLPALLIFNVYRQLNGNDALCKVVLLLTKYFRLSNYLWMFCEGLYLHRVISSSFAQNERLVVFYSIGWGLPLAFVLLYALFRALFSDTDCWAFPTSYSEWILYVPCLFSLLVNTIFLVNIIRILMSKLRASHSQESSQYRKAVRATLVLVPLFGLHFVVTIYRPANGICRWEEYYVYLDCLLDGLQGAFVAIIFCYWNGEIRSLLRRSYQNFVDRKSPRRRNGTITKYLSSSAATSTHEKSPQLQLEIVRLQT